ncbi:hypothetical protein ACFOGI_16440 [Virgibacillus xinjiangensis]|uniref:Uncharacterized protein n=1 Tax=Virgibacillus xinjiangensis TaxID=393090 RepID=A0ABV7CZG7_9BACI
MQSYITLALRVFIIMYALLHFFTYFYENEFLLLALGVAGLGIFICAVLYYTPGKIKMPLTLFLIGAMLIIFSEGSSFAGLHGGLIQMRDMIGLIVVIPLIGWVLRGEAYMEAIMQAGHRFLDTSRKFYAGMMSLTQVIAYFLMFGAIPMMLQFENWLLEKEKGEAWEHLKGTAVLRGFSLSVLWVVSIPSFAFVVEVMDAPLGISIFQGMAVSIFGVILAIIFSTFEEKRYQVDLTKGLQREIGEVLKDSAGTEEVNRLVKEFVILFITLFGTIFLLNGLADMPLLVLIPLVVLVWIIAYYLIKRRIPTLMLEARRHYEDGLAPQAYQLCIMLGAGTMIFGLNQTVFPDKMVNGLYAFQQAVPFMNVLHILPFMVIILGFFALGPLTVMVLVGGILESIHLPYPPELIVLAITTGSAISILLSPLIMPLIILSGANGLSGLKNGIIFNWKYALALYVGVQIYIQARVAFG